MARQMRFSGYLSEIRGKCLQVPKARPKWFLLGFVTVKTLRLKKTSVIWYLKMSIV
jgi:hypothetical protein